MPPLPANPEAARVEVAEGEELIVYRVVRTADEEDPAFEDSFKSHAELGLPPRGPEAAHPVIYEGISAYENQEAAIKTAHAYPKIGDFVAELRITAETGVLYLRWGPVGHLTLWAEPLTLMGTVADTIPVERENDGLHDSG
jgi:hypothetical protein